MFKRVLSFLAISVLSVLGPIAITLWFAQEGMIYHPSPYVLRPAVPPSLQLSRIPIKTRDSEGHAFLVTPGADFRPPTRLWVLFHGNASLALHWLEHLPDWPTEERAFLLVDYPGYGEMSGSPNREKILPVIEQAYTQALSRLGFTAENLEGVIGYSLGAAVGLEFASRFPPRKLLLLAPFTSLLDMACLSVGRPFCYLLVDRYDNHARLEDLSRLPLPPQVMIIHGARDEVIPVEMGRKLGAAWNSFSTFHEVPAGDHGNILALEQSRIASFFDTSGSP